MELAYSFLNHDNSELVDYYYFFLFIYVEFVSSLELKKK